MSKSLHDRKMVKPTLQFVEDSPRSDDQVEITIRNNAHPLKRVDFFIVIPVIVSLLLLLACILSGSGTDAKHILREESLRDLTDMLEVREVESSVTRMKESNWLDQIKNGFVSSFQEVQKHVFEPIGKFFGKRYDIKVEKVLVDVFERIGIPKEDVTYPLLADSLSMAYDDLAAKKLKPGYVKLSVSDVELEEALLERKTDIRALFERQANVPDWQTMHSGTFRIRYFIFVIEMLMIFSALYLIFCRACIGKSRPERPVISRVIEKLKLETWETIEFTLIASIALFSFVCGGLEAWFATGNAVGWTSPCWTGASFLLFLITVITVVDVIYHYRMFRSRD